MARKSSIVGSVLLTLGAFALPWRAIAEDKPIGNYGGKVDVRIIEAPPSGPIIDLSDPKVIEQDKAAAAKREAQKSPAEKQFDRAMQLAETDPSAGIKALQATIQAYRQRPYPENLAGECKSLIRIAGLLAQLEAPRLAQQAYLDAWKLAKTAKHPDDTFSPYSMTELGNHPMLLPQVIAANYHAFGDYAQAEKYYREFLRLETAEAEPNSATMRQTLVAIAQTQRSRMQYQQAEQTLSRIPTSAQAIDQELDSLQAYNAAANVAIAAGNYAKAIALLRKSHQIITANPEFSQHLNTQILSLNALNNLIGLHHDLGQPEKSFEYAQQAFQRLNPGQQLPELNDATAPNPAAGVLYRRLNQREITAESNFTAQYRPLYRTMQAATEAAIGNLYAQAGDNEFALQYFQSSLERVQKLAEKPQEAMLQSSLGIIQTRLGRYEAAIAAHERGLAIARTIGDRDIEASILLNLGLTRQQMGQRDQAINLQQQSLSLRQRFRDTVGAAIVLNHLGRALWESQSDQLAESTLEQAIQLQAQQRSGLSDGDKVTLADTQQETYRLLQQVYVRRNQPERALEIAEQGRAQALADLLQGEAGRRDRIAFNDIQAIARLRHITLVEYSIIDANTVYVWIVAPDGQLKFQALTVPANQALNQLVSQSRRLIGVRSRGAKQLSTESSGVTQPLEKLHQLLIAPIADQLPRDPNQSVVIMPQGSLFLVPFAALRDQRGEYLIQRHTLSVMPSIATLNFVQAAQSRPAQNPKSTALIVGDPAMPAMEGHQLPALPGARAEATAIGQLLRQSPLIGTAATKTQVVQQMQQAKIIHFATHGLLETITGEVPGALALAPSSSDAGWLSASEIGQLKLQADLVVLSACDTGRGRITGDGVIGLSRSFLAAGVPDVVVSLWQVPDEPTRSLMVNFYQHLQTGKSNRAQALRQAMLAQIKQTPDPVDWAAFTLVGGSDRQF